METEFRRREKLLSDDLPPYDGALELCRDITEAGGMNLLYTHRDSLSETMLHRYGFTPFFAGGVTAEDGFPSKPAPDALEYLMKAFSFSPEKGLWIGDRDIDLLAGKNAGIAGYLFDPMDDYASFETPFRGHSMKEAGSFSVCTLTKKTKNLIFLSIFPSKYAILLVDRKIRKGDSS